MFHLADTVQMGLEPVYVYDDVLWIPCKGMFKKSEKFGHVLDICELETFFKKLSGVSRVPCVIREMSGPRWNPFHPRGRRERTKP